MENNNDLMLFSYNGRQLRTVLINDDVWFVAKDVCDILELSDVSMSVRRLDEDEKGASKICTPGGIQDMTVISESGLYTLTLRSNKDEAKPFRRWVTHHQQNIEFAEAQYERFCNYWVHGLGKWNGIHEFLQEVNP